MPEFLPVPGPLKAGTTAWRGRTVSRAACGAQYGPDRQ